jgi:hypothetical protein
MAYQAPFRIDAAYRRRCDIRELHDARSNDPTISAFDRAFHREQLRRNGGIAQEADLRSGEHPGTVALRGAMANSDDHEVASHGHTKWK